MKSNLFHLIALSNLGHFILLDYSNFKWERETDCLDRNSFLYTLCILYVLYSFKKWIYYSTLYMIFNHHGTLLSLIITNHGVECRGSELFKSFVIFKVLTCSNIHKPSWIRYNMYQKIKDRVVCLTFCCVSMEFLNRITGRDESS